MFGKEFHITEESLPVIEEIGMHMPGGFFIYKAEQPEELLFANQAVFDIFGCEDLEEFRRYTGFTFRGMLHPDDYAAVTDSINDQIAESEDNMDYAEYRIIRKDGAVRWVDDYGHYAESDAYGGVYYVFISDITEKKERVLSEVESQKKTIKNLNETNEKLVAEKKMFERIAQSLAGDYFSIYIVDADTGDFEEYSTAEDYRQLSVENTGEGFFETSLKTIEKIVHPDDHDRFAETFNKDNIMAIIERDGSFTARYRLLTGEDSTYVTVKAMLMEDEYGRHIIVGINDITPQVMREQEYKRRADEAHDRAKNDFLANMSHDIRTPMNAIVGYTNIARDNLGDQDAVRDSLEKIGSSSHFLLSLINDILDMSKIESGKMQLSTGECDLDEILRRIRDITGLHARSKSLNITYDNSRLTHTCVLGDELRIEQVLINIVSNAIKYTPAGRSVKMTAEELPHPQEGMGRYRFVISDTGIGISEDYLPYIFDSFTREQNTKINRVQGTGLGLAITAKVVELMGGTISVESKAGEGSTFTVEIDLRQLERGSGSDKTGDTDGAEEAAGAGSDLAGRRVLLVEDNDINAEIAIMILAKHGLEAERAADGRSGLEKVADNPAGYYDAVLMDIQMPEMDGYQSTRAIRALGGDYCRDIPIIAMSANAYDEDVRRCLESGMSAHLAKPYKPEELMETLSKNIIK